MLSSFWAVSPRARNSILAFSWSSKSEFRLLLNLADGYIRHTHERDGNHCIARITIIPPRTRDDVDHSLGATKGNHGAARRGFDRRLCWRSLSYVVSLKPRFYSFPELCKTTKSHMGHHIWHQKEGKCYIGLCDAVSLSLVIDQITCHN